MASTHPEIQRTLFEHSGEAILLLGPEGAIRAANPAACRLLQRDDTEICRLDWPGLTATPSAMNKLLADCRAEGLARGQLTLIVAGGDPVLVEVTLAPGADAQGRSTFVMIGRNVHPPQAAIGGSEEGFRSVFEAMAEGVVFQDAEGRIVEINPAALAIEGRTPEQMLGLTSDDPGWDAVREDGSGFPGDEHPAMVTLRTGQPQANVVMGIRRPSGERRWISINAKPLFSQHLDKPSGVVTTFHDITEGKNQRQQLAAYVARLEKSMEQTLRAVANMVELRDPYTAGHEQRVASIAGDIAREMGWPEQRCHHLEMIALVHDIGKIAIPAQILTKPSDLTPQEYELIKMHPEWGYDILKDVDFPLPIAAIIRQHHERLDGSGYPHGLRGDEISAEARIIAVADVFEAMTAHRPYRSARSPAAALAEITAHRGDWFDPDVVDNLEAMLATRDYQVSV